MPASHDAIVLDDCGLVDLGRHGVIEASAGTGKTFTIEQLALRLLRETALALPEILFVTFTEKATGELRQRIRENLDRAFQADPGDDKLRLALEAFDDAAISTIHGFCNRVLRQHAFANGEPFEQELLPDDLPLRRRLLHDQQRRLWPRWFGERLPDMLRLAGYPGESGAWEDTVLELSRNLRPGCDRLLPDIDPALSFDELQARLRAGLAALAAPLGPGDPAAPESHPFVRDYQATGLKKNSLAPRVDKLLVPLLRLTALPAPGLEDFHAFLRSCRAYGPFDKTQDFAVLEDGLSQRPGRTACLAELVAALNDLQQRFPPAILGALLTRRCLDQLAADVQAHKAAAAQIGYDDMLRLLDRALDPEQSPQADFLLQLLRRQYRYALVDEFQDTDLIQWRIFRRIFVGSPEHRLLVIGDPKQAIYGFRGADLHVYLRARNELLDEHGGQLYRLPRNYRSRPELLAACNRLFAQPPWFGDRQPAGENLAFVPVLAPPPGHQAKWQLAGGEAALPPILPLELGSDLKAPQARRRLAERIADEIARLLHREPGALLVRAGQAPPRPLRADDFCVLVSKRSEAQPVEESLAAAGIPFSFYKKAGLYRGDEAANLLLVLDWLADPTSRTRRRKALLTEFFGLPPQDLARADELPPGHPLARRQREWCEWQARGDWPRLCRSLLEDSGLACRLIQLPEGERRLANYQQLLQDLQAEAAAASLDPAGLANRLRRYCSGLERPAESADTERRETELPKVQLMTIHASKGLEFPIVFLAGGFTRGQRGPYAKFHDDDDRICYDLGRSKASLARAEREQDTEARRLYYVALTRAIFRIYLPVDSSTAAGPLGSFILPAWRSAGLADEASPGVAPAPSAGTAAAPRSAPNAAAASPAGAAADPSLANLQLPMPLIPEVQLDLGGRIVSQGSFSSWHRRLGREERSFGSDREGAASDEFAPALAAPAAGPAPTDEPLPPGRDTGDLLHRLLEGLDFRLAAAAAGPDDFLAPGHPAGLVIRREVALLGLGEAACQETARLLCNTLRTPFAPGLRLADLAPADTRRELVFLFPVAAAAGPPRLYLKGVIDLVCRFQGRYYLLDYKSNRLDGGYGPEALRASMRREHYDLQFRLYTLALRRWWQRQMPGFDFARDFAGVYYLYLRGLNGRDDSSGVYHYRPESEQAVRDDEAVLQRLFAGQAKLAAEVPA